MMFKFALSNNGNVIAQHSAKGIDIAMNDDSISTPLFSGRLLCSFDKDSY